MKSPEIAELKQKVSLKSLFEDHGVKLVKKGRAFFGLCPFHPDKDPSLVVNDTEGLWHCMGCDAGGDAVTAIEKLEKVSFKQAVQQLREKAGCGGPYGEVHRNLAGRRSPVTAPDNSGSQAGANSEGASGSLEESFNEQDISEGERNNMLELVSSFYQRSMHRVQEGLTYLKSRGLDSETVITAGAGYAEGRLLSVLPRETGRQTQLMELGILNAQGHESFLGCVTFPLRDIQGRITGIYGRRTCGQHNGNGTNDNMDFEVKHQYMRGPRRGVWYDLSLNRRAVICECVIDAVSVMQAGIPGAVACHGTNGFTEEHETLLKAKGVQEAVVIFDGDEAGRKGAVKVRDRLNALSIAVKVKDLPEGLDLNDILRLTGPEAVRETVGFSGPEKSIVETSEGLIYESAGRRYEVKGVKVEGGHIRATVKAINGSRFHVDNIDLVQAKQRASFAAEAANLFRVDRRLVTEDLLNILSRAESMATDEEAEDAVKQMTETEREEAEAFLASPDLLGQIARDMEALGLVGEDANKQLVYLIALSRRLPSPLSAIIMSRSSAGKSTLLDKALELTPPEEQVRYTRLSSQALFYKGKDSLKHKVMVIEEQTGAQGADYALRSMQSARKLTMAVTIKDPATGRLKTVDYEVEGPVAIMISTTDAEIHHENATRAFSISVDESREQTQRIHELQRRSRSVAGMMRDLGRNRLQRKHHNAQRMLAPVRVINPYVEYLRFPDRQLRTRREHEKYLTLIETITYIFQRQRGMRSVQTPQGPIKVVETACEDILSANGLMEFVLKQTLSELSGPTVELLAAIRKMIRERADEMTGPVDRTVARGDGEIQFSRRDIREFTGWSDWQVKVHIQKLEDLEYICPVYGSRGKKYVYELGWKGELIDPAGGSCGLITEEELRSLANRLKNNTITTREAQC